MNQYEEICKDMGLRAKAAAFELAQLDQGTLDAALLAIADAVDAQTCLLYTSPSPRDS